MVGTLKLLPLMAIFFLVVVLTNLLYIIGKYYNSAYDHFYYIKIHAEVTYNKKQQKVQ